VRYGNHSIMLAASSFYFMFS